MTDTPALDPADDTAPRPTPLRTTSITNRRFAAAAHASSLLTVIGLPLIGPAVVWAVGRRRPGVPQAARVAIVRTLIAVGAVVVGSVAHVYVTYTGGAITGTLGRGIITAALWAVALWWLVVTIRDGWRAWTGTTPTRTSRPRTADDIQETIRARLDQLRRLIEPR